MASSRTPRKISWEKILRRALLAGSLALGIVTGSGIAFAFWSTTSPEVAIPQLQAGTFDLTVNGQLAGQQGGTYNWDAFSGASALYPLESWAEQASLNLGNNSTGDHAYLVATITGQASNVSGFGDSGQYLNVTVYSGATAANTGTVPHRTGTCSGGTQITSTTVGAFAANPITLVTTGPIAPGANLTVNLCVLVQVAANFPNPSASGVAGGTANFGLNISAQQVQP